MSEIEPQSRKAAAALNKNGIKLGDTIQVVLPNSIGYHWTVFGAWLLGAKASLADPGLRDEILHAQLEETSAKMIFCQDKAVDTFKGLLPKSLTISSLLSHLFSLLAPLSSLLSPRTHLLCPFSSLHSPLPTLLFPL